MFRPNHRRRFHFKSSLVLLLLTAAVLRAQAPEEDLDVLAPWRLYSDAPNFFYKHIAARADEYLDQRETGLKAINSAAGWEAYRASVQARLQQAFGPLPEKTPLNAKVVGKLEHQGVTIEKILYESRPGFLVNAAFYKAKGARGRLPAVLYVCGHSVDGYKSAVYEHIALNLALKGFAVLAIDPVGQGERYQYLDSTGTRTVLGGTTSEHSYAGVLCLPLGRSMAAVRLWDGIRAIDYLCERPDVDTRRIAVQGRSGGGTMSAYLGAMDSRIAAAAPECYIAGFRRIFQSIGPQDAEQNLLEQIKLGLDHGDFLFARMPKPSLLVTTTRDYFSIQGARETYTSLQPGFAALGQPENIGMIEDDSPHASTKANRERVYAFFMRAFGMSGATDDIPTEPVDTALMRVTKTGMVVTSGSRTIYDIIKQDAAPLLAGLDRSRRHLDHHKQQVAEKSAELSGLERSDFPPVGTVFRGGIQREGYRIEKLILDPGSSLPIPCLVLVQATAAPKPAVLLLSPEGKRAEAAPGGLADSLALAGYIVLIPDLPGVGELAASQQGDDSVIKGINYNLLFGTQLIGASITGIQASSANRVLQYLLARPDIAPGGICAVARGTMGAALLHIGPVGRYISSLVLLGSPLSWESLYDNMYYDLEQGMTVVPGALKYYDLPDLMGLVAPRRLLVIDPVDGQGKAASDNAIQHVNGIVSACYGAESGAFAIRKSGGESVNSLLINWIK